jgi:hypothetical protein
MEYLNNPVIAGHNLAPWPHIKCVQDIAKPVFCATYQPPGVQLYLNMLAGTKDVPDPILEAVRSYSNCQLPLLALAGMNQNRFLQLHQQSPALCHTLAVAIWLNPKRSGLIPVTQRTLWALLGFDGSRSFARQMARISASLVDPDILAVIRVRWANSAKFRRLFRHAPQVNKSVLMCFQMLHEEELHPNFIQIAAEDERMGRDVHTWIQMLVSHYHLMYPLMPLPYRNIKSFQSLQRAYARLERRFNCGEECEVSENHVISYPKVLRESCSVRRVENSYQLWDLAQRMQNCIFRYHERIRAGLAAVFTVPSRDLTILVEKVQGRWKLTAMEGSHGCCPRLADWAAINEWQKENDL